MILKSHSSSARSAPCWPPPPIRPEGPPMINMNSRAGASPLDKTDSLVGRPLDRIDGSLKVTGRATYAYEYREAGAPAYGYLVEAGIAKGRLTALDVAAAERAPGVILVLTHENAPK